MTIHPPPDAAPLIFSGRPAGVVSWSQFEDGPGIIISVEPMFVPLVHRWAAALGGEFHEQAP